MHCHCLSEQNDEMHKLTVEINVITCHKLVQTSLKDSEIDAHPLCGGKVSLERLYPGS